MPPVRTTKQNTAATNATPVGKRPKTMWLKPIPKGNKEAFFKSSERDWDDNKEFMKAMRALGKERQAMTITLVRRSEEKKWGDWELETIKQNYKKGRKHDLPYDDAPFDPFYSRYNRFW